MGFRNLSVPVKFPLNSKHQRLQHLLEIPLVRSYQPFAPGYRFFPTGYFPNSPECFNQAAARAGHSLAALVAEGLRP